MRGDTEFQQGAATDEEEASQGIGILCALCREVSAGHGARVQIVKKAAL
jgi:hypothetical protein